jgi:hypothetical protein
MLYGDAVSELYSAELFVGEDGMQIVIPIP